MNSGPFLKMYDFVPFKHHKCNHCGAKITNANHFEEFNKRATLRLSNTV